MQNRFRMVAAAFALCGVIAVFPVSWLVSGGANQSTSTANDKMDEPKLEVATFGAGCFWCVEAVFDQLAGVHEVVSGFSGGHVENPTYRQVVSGTTGHAEVCQIQFDPAVIKYEQLLEVLFATHDPTTLNRQGPDVGTQYRSAIFYHSEEQKRLAETYIEALGEAEVFDSPIVTEVTQFEKFFPADDYHQNYFARNPEQAYCQRVIRPKVEKVRQMFEEKLKEGLQQR